MKNTVANIVNHLNNLHWLWLALAAPLLLFPSPKRSLALLIIPFLWLLNWIANRLPPTTTHQPYLPPTPLNSAIFTLALMVLVSTWATYDIEFSLPKISGMVLGIAVFFALVRESRKGKRFWLLLAGFLASGIGVAGIGLLGTDWFSSKLAILNPITSRIPNLIGGLQGAEGGFHPNEIAGALIWVLPLLGTISLAAFKPLPGLKIGQNWALRIILWPSTIFVAGVFVLSQSRGGYLGLAITGLISLLLLLPARWRWGLLGLLMVAGVVIAFVFSQEEFLIARDWMIGSGVTTENALSLNTLEGRVEIWSRAIYGLQDFPFTGMGMNTFREVVHVLYPLFLVAPDVDFGHAHNEFLQAGLDLGIPGLIAFIALYLLSFWMLAKMWRATLTLHPSPLALHRLTILGLGGGLFAHLLYGLTDAVALGAKPGIIFWCLLGLIAGLHRLMFPEFDL